MEPLTAARLIELLAGHITEQRVDLPVRLWVKGAQSAPIVRAWWDEETRSIMLHME